LIFEKVGKDTSFKHKIKGKWKEIIIFFFLLFMLLTISICKENRLDEYSQTTQEFCRYKDSIMIYLGLGVLMTVGIRFLLNKIEKINQKKRK